jgi:hypothetical protein
MRSTVGALLRSRHGFRRYGRTGDGRSAGPTQTVPLLRGAADGRVRRSRHVPDRELARPGGPARGDGAVLSPARVRVRALLPRPGGGVRGARGDLRRLHLLLVVLDELAGPLEGVHGRDRGTAVARSRPHGRRGGVERRLPAPVLPRARHPGDRHRAGGQRRAGGDRQGNPDDRALLRHAAGRGAPGRVVRRPPDRQQRARAHARRERLRGRDEGSAQAERRDHRRVPAPRAACRGQPVRHDLPRALLLLLVLDGDAHIRAARAARVRRRGTAHARRLAARLRAPPGERRAPGDRPRG